MAHDSEKFCAADVWTVSLGTPRAARLTADEQARAARFHLERDRVQWTRARSALREVLSGYLGAEPLSLAFAIGPHGKPSVRGLEFNLSHAGGWALIAVSLCAPVGIDVEAIRENVGMGKLLKRIGETETTGTTAELFQRWSRREARTKAVGGPLMEIPGEDVRVVDLEAPEGCVAALAMVGREPVVTYRGGV